MHSNKQSLDLNIYELSEREREIRRQRLVLFLSCVCACLCVGEKVSNEFMCVCVRVCVVMRTNKSKVRSQRNCV